MSRASRADNDPGAEDFEARLAGLRQRVDTIDTQLLGLLNARAAVVADIYALKKSGSVQRLDSKRTEAIVERLANESAGPLSAADVRELIAPMLKFFVERYAPPEDATRRPAELSGN